MSEIREMNGDFFFDTELNLLGIFQLFASLIIDKPRTLFP